MNTHTIDIKNLCSRKLWELLVENQQSAQKSIDNQILEQELLSRRHYLNELQKLRRHVASGNH